MGTTHWYEAPHIVAHGGPNARFSMFSREANDYVAEQLRQFNHHLMIHPIGNRTEVLENLLRLITEISEVHSEVHDTEPMMEISIWANENVLTPRGFLPIVDRIDWEV